MSVAVIIVGCVLLVAVVVYAGHRLLERQRAEIAKLEQEIADRDEADVVMLRRERRRRERRSA